MYRKLQKEMNQPHLPGTGCINPFPVLRLSTLNSAHKIHKESMVIVDHLINVEFEVKYLLYSVQVGATLYFGSGLLTCLFFRNYSILCTVFASDTALMLPGPCWETSASLS